MIMIHLIRIFNVGGPSLKFSVKMQRHVKNFLKYKKERVSLPQNDWRYEQVQKSVKSRSLGERLNLRSFGQYVH